MSIPGHMSNTWRAPGTKRPASTHNAYNSHVWRKFGHDEAISCGRRRGGLVVDVVRDARAGAAAERRRPHGEADQSERSPGEDAARGEDRQGLRSAEDGVGRPAN